MRALLGRVLFIPIAFTYYFIKPRLERSRCLLVKDNQVLLIRNLIGQQRWTLPGGSAKRHESFEAAARREVKEELDLNLDKLRSLGKIVVKGTYYTLTAHVFAAWPSSYDFKYDVVEILDARWFSLDKLPANRSVLVDKSLTTFHLKKLSKAKI